MPSPFRHINCGYQRNGEISRSICALTLPSTIQRIVRREVQKCRMIFAEAPPTTKNGSTSAVTTTTTAPVDPQTEDMLDLAQAQQLSSTLMSPAYEAPWPLAGLRHRLFVSPYRCGLLVPSGRFFRWHDGINIHGNSTDLQFHPG